ncbi:MAG: hypothetical protein ACLUBZ_13760 [Ruthenibacterium lactatiformans]|uniref:hypothetical protein n=1 Tax=Ruthenibacterium lactatiformans TaxID=1550024 RepID=UPI003996B377
MERITLAPGAHINVLPAEKFNRCRISINFIWPAAREWATAEPCCRGCWSGAIRAARI